jgi:tetratricopeptide (TPR) repeat protein
VTIRTALISAAAFVVLAVSASAAAQDIDPSGGTYKPPVARARPVARTPRPAPRPTPKPPKHGDEPKPPKHGDAPKPDQPPPVTPDAPETAAEHEPAPEAVRHYELGGVAYDRNDLETAVTEYEAAIKIDGKYLDALLQLGAAYYDLSDLDSALDVWKRALFLDKTVPELHNNVANASFVLHDYDKALAEYKAAIDLRPNYYDALFGLGNTLVALKRYDEAVPLFQRAIDARGTPFPDARTNMAWALLRSGKLDDAATTARQAIQELGPEAKASVKTWYVLAATLTEKADYVGAADALRKSIAVCDGCPPEQVGKLYYSLAKVLEVNNDNKGAADALEQYLKLAPYVTNADDVREKIAKLRSH